MDGRTKMCKYFLILSTAVFALVGIGLAVLGALVWVNTHIIAAFSNREMTEFIIGVTVLIITGLLMLLAASIGYGGVSKQNKSALYVFSGLLSFLIIIEITEGVMAFVWKGQVSDELVEMYTTIYNQFKDGRLQKFHSDFKCCGISRPDDICPDGSGFTCPSVIQEMVNSKVPLVVGGFLGMAGITMLALVCSVVLIRHISGSATPYVPSSEEQKIMQDVFQLVQDVCK